MNRERWLVLAPLVDRALELTGDARVTWLAELRMRSPALAAELTAFLSREDVADRRGFLSEPLDVKLEGLTLGAYTIERPLGEGGMGTVWLARRTDGQGDERAAVKFLNLALASVAGKERFRREGAMLTRLDHPAIARLFDAGLTRTGQPFLVLEYVDGVRIDAYVETQQLSLGERIRLVLQVLAAVGHAHANRIVHRDLKPSNILVTRDRSVKLLDRRAHRVHLGKRAFTHAGVRGARAGARRCCRDDNRRLRVRRHLVCSRVRPSPHGRRSSGAG